MFGTDAEKALTKAIRDVFPGATQLLCVSHLQDSYMKDKCGAVECDRKNMVSKIFSADGPVNSVIQLCSPPRQMNCVCPVKSCQIFQENISHALFCRLLRI